MEFTDRRTGETVSMVSQTPSVTPKDTIAANRASQQRSAYRAQEGLYDPMKRRQGPRVRRGNDGQLHLRETKQQQYQRQGFVSIGKPDTATKGAGKLRPLPDWQSKPPEEQQKIEGKFKDQYDVNMRQATRTIGRNIDRGFSETRKAARAAGWRRPKGGTYEAEGQRFYHGTDRQVATPLQTQKKGTFSMDRDEYGRDPGSNRQELVDLAKEHEVSTPTGVAARATVSPRVKLPAERKNAESTFAHVEAGKKVDVTSPKQFSPGEHIEGVALQGNAQKAARIISEGKQGANPLDVQYPRMARGENTGEPLRNPKTGDIEMGKALSGPKVEGYYQSYVYPNDPRGRGPMDVHAMSQAKPKFQVTAKGQTKQIDDPEGATTVRTSGKKKGQEVPVKVQNPEWKSNAEDLAKEPGSHEFLDEAHARASRKRGLTKTEGQSIGWHVQRRYVRGITDPEDRGGD